jgi:hypothetical protein
MSPDFSYLANMQDKPTKLWSTGVLSTMFGGCEIEILPKAD